MCVNRRVRGGRQDQHRALGEHPEHQLEHGVCVCVWRVCRCAAIRGHRGNVPGVRPHLCLCELILKVIYVCVLMLDQVRWKPPPSATPCGSRIGWRTEFRCVCVFECICRMSVGGLAWRHQCLPAPPTTSAPTRLHDPSATHMHFHTHTHTHTPRRFMEIQLTDFENAAFTVFVYTQTQNTQAHTNTYTYTNHTDKSHTHTSTHHAGPWRSS